MKRIVLLVAGLLLTLSLTACGAKLYNVETHSGDVYTSEGEPKYDAESDTYKFEDQKGAEYIIKKDDLKVIKEVEKK